MKKHQDKTFYLIAEDVLPEVFLKVAAVKTALAEKKYSSVNQAVKELGISRSAYYKYRNSVFFYRGTDFGPLDLVTILYEFDAGFIREMLTVPEQLDVDLLTMQQSIVSKGLCSVQLGLRWHQKRKIDALLILLRRLPGVRDVTLWELNE